MDIDKGIEHIMTNYTKEEIAKLLDHVIMLDQQAFAMYMFIGVVIILLSVSWIWVDVTHQNLNINKLLFYMIHKKEYVKPTIKQRIRKWLEKEKR